MISKSRRRLAAPALVVALTAPRLLLASTVASTTGAVASTPPPASIVWNALQSDSQISLIQERLGAIVAAPLAVDVDGTPGLYDQASDRKPGQILAGSHVDVHLLHFDPFNNPVRLSGSVTFNRPIVGLSFTLATLLASDVLGAAGTVYPTAGNSSFREFELSPGTVVGDLAEISPDRRTLSVDWGVTEYYDELRVFTAVPEPAAVVEFATAAVALGLCLRVAESSQRRVRHTTRSLAGRRWVGRLGAATSEDDQAPGDHESNARPAQDF